MTIDQATLAMRLRQAREHAGLTQEEAAEAVGLSRTALVQIEGVKRSVSSLELAKLAERYVIPIDSFFQDDGRPDQTQEAPVQVVYRAIAGTDGNPALRRHVERAVALCQDGVHLESLLGRAERTGPPAYNLAAPERKSDAANQGFKVAVEERKRLELGDASIADMADLIAGQQIWASGADFPDEISGVFFNDQDIGLVILVNFDHVRARKRFSYAHEYAHALLDRNATATVSRFENRDDLREVRANAFAAAFLMPEGGVLAALNALSKGSSSRTYSWVYDQATESAHSPAIQAEERAVPGSQSITFKDIATLAFHFGVSYRAATYRLRNLGVVNQEECDARVEQEELGREYLSVLHLSEFDRRDDQPDRELRSQIAYLSIEAFRREQISSGRLLELSRSLDIPGEKLLRLARAAV